MSEGKLKNCHVEERRSPDVNISAYSHPSFSLENVKGSSNYKTIKSGRSLDLAYLLGAMTRRDCHVASLLTITTFLFSFNAQATCTPTPDCASIGYTETSCEGDYLACPFDSTKLKCIPCDSSFRYDCSGDNITGGTGSACGGKYVSCECSDNNYIYKNGKCIKAKCPVGYIYYSDKSCSSEFDNTKIAIGVIVKSDTLIMSTKYRNIAWGSTDTDIINLNNITNSTIAIADYNGKNNTLTMVNSQIAEGLTSLNSAAIYCYEYSTDGTNTKDWYLPALGELYQYVYKNYSILQSIYSSNFGWGTFRYWLWSSTEYNNEKTWYVYSHDGYMAYTPKDGQGYVTCFLAIN